MLCLYIGTSYFIDDSKVSDPQTVCIDESFDAVFNYLTKIRRLNVVDNPYDHEQLDALPQNCDICAAITMMRFANEEQQYQFLIADGNQPYVMWEYGKVDRNIVKLGKKEAKNVKVPHIVEEIIAEEVGTFAAEAKVAAHTLKQLLYYINGYDKAALKLNNVARSLITSIDLLTRVAVTKGTEIEDDMYRRHHILFCGEHEYRATIRRYLEMHQLDQKFRDHLYDE